jgi:hypothetical protein
LQTGRRIDCQSKRNPRDDPWRRKEGGRLKEALGGLLMILIIMKGKDLEI